MLIWKPSNHFGKVGFTYKSYAMIFHPTSKMWETWNIENMKIICVADNLDDSMKKAYRIIKNDM